MVMEMKLFFLLYSLCCCIANAEAARPASSGTFNVKNFGARANGRTDDSKAFMAAWKAACTSTGAVKLLIPGGTYLVGPVRFQGPCKSVPSFTVQMQGNLKAVTDLNKYNGGWVQFGWVDNLTVTGGGTFDGQGAVSWPFNKCPKEKNCKVLPTSVTFVNTVNTVVKGITSVNSKFFHIALIGCKNFHGSGIKISAPANSPNTDGIHLERNSGVTISDSKIGTGDDCVSVGQGNSQVSLSSITCGPGHGISVGSLGRYKNEGDVQGLVVKDCKLFGTLNGLRIKTWANSPTSSTAANMTYENVEMTNVANPIIIDQTYCPYTNCASSVPSRVKISNISFKNIRGTSTTPVAVTLRCSKGMPCQNVTLHDVSLKYVGGGSGTGATTTATAATTAMCLNVKAEFSGIQNPPPCQ